MRPVSGSSNSSPVHNCLLAALLPADFALMRRHFRPPVPALKQDIERPNWRIEFVCFVKTGIASVVAIQSETRVEVGLIGREGMGRTAVVLGGRRQWTSGGGHARYLLARLSCCKLLGGPSGIGFKQLNKLRVEQ